jgi:hypothetical protein
MHRLSMSGFVDQSPCDSSLIILDLLCNTLVLGDDRLNMYPAKVSHGGMSFSSRQRKPQRMELGWCMS